MLEILHAVFAWACSASAAIDVGLVAITGLSLYLVMVSTLAIDLPWSKAPLKPRPDPFMANRLASADLKQLIADIRARPPVRMPAPRIRIMAPPAMVRAWGLTPVETRTSDRANHPTIHCNRF